MRRLFPLIALFALTTACAPDRDASQQDAAAQDSLMEEEVYVPPVLTPAESAAAVAKIQAEADAATRRVMGPDYKPPTDTFVDTPEKQYASCMAQAQSLEDAALRSTILSHCARMRARGQQK